MADKKHHQPSGAYPIDLTRYKDGDEAEKALRAQAADEVFHEVEQKMLVDSLEKQLELDGYVPLGDSDDVLASDEALEEALGHVLEGLFPTKTAPKPKPPVKEKKAYELKPHLTNKPFRGDPKLLKLRKELRS